MSYCPDCAPRYYHDIGTPHAAVRLRHRERQARRFASAWRDRCSAYAEVCAEADAFDAENVALRAAVAARDRRIETLEAAIRDDLNENCCIGASGTTSAPDLACEPGHCSHDPLRRALATPNPKDEA